MLLIEEVDAVLRGAGFLTRNAVPERESLHFEDANLLGFVRFYPTAEELIGNWQNDHHEFLRRNAPNLRRDPVKAWNVYAIFFTPERDHGVAATSLLAIEEDISATRKIARGGIASRSAIQRALAPLLPISGSDTHAPHDYVELLRNRLDSGERRLFDLMLAAEGDMDRATLLATLAEPLS